MRHLLLLILTLSTRFAFAQANCTVHLLNDLIEAPQVEFTRHFVQSALPAARDVTLVRLTDLEAGVRAMGYSDHGAFAFTDVLDRTLQLSAVRGADPDSVIGHAARRLALSARNHRALAVALVHQTASPEVLLIFASRDATIAAKTGNGPNQPTFAALAYQNMPEAPTPHGLLLIEPARYTDRKDASYLPPSLLSAAGTYEVLLTLHEWAIAQKDRLKGRRVSGLAGYLNVDRRGTVFIDEGFAHLLMFSQNTAIHLALETSPGEAKRRSHGLLANVADHAKARRLARTLRIGDSAEDLIEWSNRTMTRLYDDLAGVTNTP